MVEGASDRDTARAVVLAAGHQPGTVHDKGGKGKIDPLLKNYNLAARRTPWVVFRDTDSHCPVQLRESLLSDLDSISPYFELRLAHSMTEAWLLADASGFAKFFQVSQARIPRDPEKLVHAKQEVLNQCRRSRSRRVREGMTAGNSEIGPLYVEMINRFAREEWNVARAMERSESLERAVRRISSIGE